VLPHASRIYASASSVTIGPAPEVLLAIPKIGTLSAACTARGGRLSDRFTLSKSAPSNASAVVTVSPGAQVYGTDTKTSLAPPTGPAAAVSQTWQISPFSSGSITVATIWVSAQPAPAAFGRHGCVAAAQAAVTTLPR
jgi:hypothetical protein